MIIQCSYPFNAVVDWCDRWQLSLNVNKTNCLVTGNCKHQPNYYVNGQLVCNVSEACDLGVMVESNLKFKMHCNRIAKKAYFILYNMFKTFENHGDTFYLKLYCTYVRPILESASEVWNPKEICNINTLERVQKYFTRKLKPNIQGYLNRLKILNLQTLEERRIISDLLCFKKMWLNNFEYMPNFSNEFTFNNGNRRQYGKLNIPYCRTETRKGFYCNRVVPLFNSISTNVLYQPYCKFKFEIKNMNFNRFCRGSCFH